MSCKKEPLSLAGTDRHRLRPASLTFARTIFSVGVAPVVAQTATSVPLGAVDEIGLAWPAVPGMRTGAVQSATKVVRLPVLRPG